MELRGKKVVVMGLGVHGGGLGVARFCAEAGADVVVTDLRNAELLADSLAALADLPITYVLGEHRVSDFTSCDIVVQNPAVPATSPYVMHARHAGARIEMEMTLFFVCVQPPSSASQAPKEKQPRQHSPDFCSSRGVPIRCWPATCVSRHLRNLRASSPTPPWCSSCRRLCWRGSMQQG